MTNRRLEKSLKQSNKKKEDKVLLISGELGIPLNGQKLVEVPNRQGFVFVRLKNNTSELIQAYNTAVSPIYGLPVLVARQVGVYKVIGRNVDRYTNQWGQAPYLPKHGAQHSFNPDINIGGDVVWVYSPQFMPLLAYPSGTSGSPRLSIAPYIIRGTDGAWKYVGNTGTPDTTPYNPTTGSRAVMGLVYLDTVSGNPYLLINSGTYIDDSLTGTNQIVDYIPHADNPNWIPLAGVRLLSGTNQLSWNNVYDLRPFLQVMPTGTSSGGGGGGGGSGIGFVAWDEGIFLGTGTVLNFVGAGVTATISGTVVNVNVPSSGGGTATGSVTIWDDGIVVGAPAILNVNKNLYATMSGTVANLDALPTWFDVESYGAVGTSGTYNDAAINRAIDALNANGRGILYFPAGDYYCTGSFHNITVPCTIMGDGSSSYDSTENISRIICTSTTAVLFNVTAKYAFFNNLTIENNSGAVTAGAGIQVAGSYWLQKVDYDHVRVVGFYINVDVQVGYQWFMSNCFLKGAKLYNLKINNTVNPDAGGWGITNSTFHGKDYHATANIRIESSGGGKISNCKITTDQITDMIDYGIDIAGSGNTSILMFSNNSIECMNLNAIRATGNFDYIIIDGLQVGHYFSTTNAIVLDGPDYFIITNCTFTGMSIANTPAIVLSNCTNGIIKDNIYRNFSSRISQTSCSNILLDDIEIQNNGISQGFAETLNFVGNIFSNISGTIAAINISGSSGGGSTVVNNPLVVYDDGNYFASGTQISFDNNLYLGLSGTIIHVASPVSTYQRFEQPVSLQGGTGTLFQVPDQVYASGSLGVFYNGLLQLRGYGYEELVYSSGTYQLLFSPATGSSHMVSYGVPCIPQPFFGTTGANIMVDSLGSPLTDSNGIQLVDSNG